MSVNNSGVELVKAFVLRLTVAPGGNPDTSRFTGVLVTLTVTRLVTRWSRCN